MSTQKIDYMTSPQVAIVSGGSRGLGRAFTEALLAAGWCVAIFARRTSEFTESAPSNPAYAGRFMTRQLDVRNGPEVDAYVQEVIATWGKLNLLVNNAAIAGWAPLAIAEDEFIDWHIDTNLGGVLRLTRSAAKQMMRQRWGRIINISSVVGIRGFGGLAAYSATKAAVDGLTRTLAMELGSSGVTVNAIAPGYINTEMTAQFPKETLEWNRTHSALLRLGTVEDFVPPFMFLASEGAGFITGHTLVVDGGLVT
ncbi:MAG TPA: SDR family oxidoreductase [Bacteroidetes bacterium]|nr:SDR family oxidoreductase [Bacteroidota bacterium]HEX04181.1 SDR family oxidoreductase [Bacteroidota bacterium]